jgi:hypothetical protein
MNVSLINTEDSLKPHMLHVILPYSNDEMWNSRPKTFSKTLQHVINAGASVTVVEAALGGRAFIWDKVPGINHVAVRHSTTLWTKENLINIGIQRLPHSWKYVCWMDGDVIFRKPSWVMDTLHALQRYQIIQPWSDAYDLGPHDEHMQAHKSFCYQWWHKQPVSPKGPNWWKFSGGPYDYPHSGYCWAAVRDFIERVGGLIEICILGAADHHMALGLVGEILMSVPGYINEAYLDILRVWEARAVEHGNYSIGYIQGTIEHAFHGRKADRRYVDRWKIITESNFDPRYDIKKNVYGVYELAGNKPKLTLDLLHYMMQRNEDANTLA